MLPDTPNIAEADLALRQLAAISADMAHRERYYQLSVCAELRKALKADASHASGFQPGPDFSTEQRAELVTKWRKLLLSL